MGRKFWRGLFLGLGALAILLFPKAARAAIENGLNLCRTGVIPSLFLFLCAGALSRRLYLTDGIERRLGFLFRALGIPGAAAGAFVMGNFCGYPVGALELCAQVRQGRLSRQSGERLLEAVCAPSPAFLCARIGEGLFGKAQAGLLLWGICLICHYALYRLGKKRPEDTARVPERPSPPFLPALGEAVGEGAATLLRICAQVLFYSSLVALLPLWALPDWTRALIGGFFEMTTGLSALSAPTALSFAAAAFLAELGGLCVLSQILPEAQAAGLSIGKFCLRRMVSALLSGMIAFLLFPLLG